MKMLKLLIVFLMMTFCCGVTVFAGELEKTYEQSLLSGEDGTSIRTMTEFSHRDSNNIDVGGKNLFPLCALFSFATRHSEGVDELKKHGWDIETVTFDKTPREVVFEIKSDLTLNYNLNYIPVSEQIKKIENKEVKIFFNECTGKYTKSLDIKQHYGFLLGEKTIDNRNVYIIAFRGTDDLYSWFFTDFVCTPSIFQGEYVHTGFKWHTETCMKTKELQRFIKKIQNDVKNDKDPLVIVTGHSLGAATAVLGSVYLVNNEKIPKENICLVSLAEPFPGSKGFVARYSKYFPTYTLVVNKFDPIPITMQLIGYGHLKEGKVIRFKKKSLKIANLHLIGTYKKFIDKNFSK